MVANNFKHVALYCDEAGKDTDTYLAVGGLIVTSSNAEKVKERFRRVCSKAQISGEVKWNRIKKGNCEKFRLVVDLFFSLANEGLLEFHCILTNFDRFDHDLRA